MGLLDTVALFGAVALAAPIALLGAEFVVGGRPIEGVAFLAIAAGLLAGVYYRPSIGSVGERVAGRTLDAIATEGPEDDAAGDRQER